MNVLKGIDVLLLEDEFLIALDAQDILQDMDAGRVEVASTLEEARALAETGRFDVALLDVNINGVMSFPVAALLRQRGVPVVFTTGYELDPDALPQPLAGNICVTKPYTAEALRDALAHALARAPMTG
jgi:CheY-like chemotaxis protein